MIDVFGYVTVAKDQLTEEEYETFCAYYCGVCKSAGKYASQASRLGLSYDITFLAIVLSAVTADSTCSPCERCIAHPIKKRKCVHNDKAVDYASAMGVMLDYLKLADDWHDEHSIKALFGILLLLPGYRRVKKNYRAQSELIKKQLDILSRLEEANCDSIDEAADAFAKILEGLFTPDFIENENRRRTLAWFGYNLGRWIYIADAFHDIEKDKKNHSYNPLISAGMTDKEQCKAALEPSMSFTLENIASAFELTDFKQNKSIIGKIVYTSLKLKQQLILSGRDNA